MRNGRRTLFNVLFLFLECTLLAGAVLVYSYTQHSIAPFLSALQIIAVVLFGGIWIQIQSTERALSKSLDSPIDILFSNGATELVEYLAAVKRKESLLMPQIVEGKIGSKEDLSRILERLVSTAFRICSAESAELSLFNRDSGQYHSSIAIGRPFRESIDEVIDDLGKNKNSLIEPITFAGTVLGALRVAIPRGRILSEEERSMMRFLALQTSIALVNADFVAELLRMKQLSEDSVKAKTGFLANLSHELRGPLGIILNAVELVLEGLCGSVTDDQRETLSMVRSNGAHLLELINDVLDYAKVESGKITPQKVDISVNDLLIDIASVVRAQADAKKHILKTDITDVLYVSCDRRHLRQMLINMLTNAIKYTPDGGTITLTAERMTGGKVKILVSDTGIGIAPEDRVKVFSAFERIDNPYALKQVGTGLGMPLTKKLVEINGGTLDFSSEAGKGSQFWILLGQGSDASHDSNEEPLRVKIDGKGAVVLMIAAPDVERALNERYLSEHSFNVIAASNPTETTKAATSSEISLILIDENCRDAFEMEPASFVRDLLQTTAIPIVLLSSKAFVFDVERNLRAGVDRHVSKPITLHELGAICIELVEKESRVNKKGGSSVFTDKPPTIH